MHIHRCRDTPTDHLAVGTVRHLVLLVVTITSPNGRSSVELDLTPTQARDVANALRTVQAEAADHGDYQSRHRVEAFLRARGDFVVSVLDTDGTENGHAIAFTTAGVRRLAEHLDTAADTADTTRDDPDTATTPYAPMVDRATALALTHAALDRPDVDLVAVAEWVRTGT
ncbi:hypothetical protein JOD54_000808 [Actinokineospora baliensis]|uniref:hypothetical protein n=1 Tax=Actinokineospora baliensis TaxID=547056 RepID=UPI00195E8177|nr:hypothetical protein [Actinokineospora baliensis]MBM7770604.1 hypothetical protein [Actinokineospora baliensis]